MNSKYTLSNPPPRPRKPGEAVLKVGKQAFDPSTHARWSNCQRTPANFLETYKKDLPKLITVTEGYYGGNDFDVYGAEEVILITGCSAQPRVVARDLTFNQGYISIPYDYRTKFEVLNKMNKGDGKPRTIGEILEKYKLPVVVRMCRQKEIRFCLSADIDCLAKFQDLRLEAKYQERYLLGNRVVTGFIAHDSPCSIPVYLPIKVAVAVCPLDKSITEQQWTAVMKTMREMVSDCDYSKHEMNKELMLFNKEDIDAETKIYDQIMPRYLLKQSGPQLPVAASVRRRASPKEDWYVPTTKDRDVPTTEDRNVPTKEDRYVPTTKDRYVPTTEERNVPTKEDRYVPTTKDRYVPTTKDRYVRTTEERNVPTKEDRHVPTTKDRYVPTTEDRYVTRAPPAIPRASTYAYEQLDLNVEPKRDTVSRGPLPDRPPIQSLESIPADISTLTVSEVADCMNLLHMGDLAPMMKHRQVNGALLCALEPADFQEEFGMTKLSSKKLYMFANKGWRPDKE